MEIVAPRLLTSVDDYLRFETDGSVRLEINREDIFYDPDVMGVLPARRLGKILSPLSQARGGNSLRIP